MNRKHFLSSLITSGAALSSLKTLAGIDLPASSDVEKPLAPPYLKPGDIIGITCPAGYIQREEIQPAIRIMESWGFNIRIGKAVGARDFSFGGTDAERLADLQAMLDDDSIKAIMCGRGGYGTARIIDQLNFSRFRRKPKWIIGFSDATVLHCHINRHFGIASLHAKMCNSFPDEFSKAEPVVQDTIMSIYQALTGKRMQYSAPPDAQNRKGKARGVIIGGNLSIIQSMCGTDSEIDTNGKILFLEEVGEYLYSLDRMLGTLQRSHKLDHLAGLVIGGFNKIKPDDPGEEFGRTVYDMVFEKIKHTSFPVCFNFPVGHQKNNYALKCGMMHTLNVTDSGTTLAE
ncbi:LD-carboxypeptidase [Chitinophaga polysaccharea]|uniref:S66 peptidase family protein n=1 Tax=Chitinophaga TaxID=79328 RepID=UPI0014552CF2|nr:MULTISPECIES: LD-carboxypeptidase [Chitinophaga]NLR56747.1 LD-carboxypeptidase [Chitinophaga polysaccharea]NLU92975.1 LD-carboxypeptidase [Chitinophaga sp. Ak27]